MHTPEEMDFFLKHGYLHVPGVLDTESLRVRSLHADLPFHGHVPHGDVMGQRFMLGRRAAVLGAHVTARVVLEMRPSFTGLQDSS